jgi:aminoglycoside 6'-N-acetyltransferase
MIRGAKVTLRPIEPRDRAPLKAIRDEPEVIRFWGRQTEEWPGDDDSVEEWVVELGGELIGFVQFCEEPDDDYRHADVDILLATAHHGQGLGTDAMRAVMAFLVEQRGHHRITLTTWPHNERAIHLYEKLGFRQVGITRASERGDDGTWHDELLMEYVVEPPPRREPPGGQRSATAR